MDILLKLLIMSSTLTVASSNTMASPIDEALVDSAYAEGSNIYNSCIAVPPVDPNAVAACTTLYITYLATLSLVNAPLPMLPSSDQSPYSWSPFDICRQEVAHMVFNSATQTPYYCPTL